VVGGELSDYSHMFFVLGLFLHIFPLYLGFSLLDSHMDLEYHA
jgi:hypothetical protein